MAIYIDRKEIPDPEHIPAGVLRYTIEKHRAELRRLDTLYRYYTARNTRPATSKDEVQLVVSYPRYIVDTILGFYLGDPVKYDADNETEKETGITPGAIEATVKNGRVIRHAWQTPEADISPVTLAYEEQSIAEADSHIGRDVGLYGEAYELEYASDGEIPQPKTAVCDPRCSVMVRDTTVDHDKIFFLTYERRERTDRSIYYIAYVYTDQTVKQYIASESLQDFREIPGTEEHHFFGEVPAVEYQNNIDRLGDFETVTSLIDALNQLMSDRCTDKRKFIDSILAVYGASIDDEDKEDLKKYKMLDNLPIEARIEYIQKVFDESSVHILTDDIIREIHKQTMTVDMTDEKFAGNSSGQALKLKLLTMNMLVKNKIRNLEKGLRKRFEMYNHWLAIQGTMPIIPKKAITPVFTISMPINEAETVSIVKQLDGIVDKKTLISLLWFVRDPEKVIEKAREEREEAQRQYLDTFGITARRDEDDEQDS